MLHKNKIIMVSGYYIKIVNNNTTLLLHKNEITKNIGYYYIKIVNNNNRILL